MVDRNATGREAKPAVNEVEKGAIRRFAEAIGETNPIYFEEAAARAAVTASKKTGRPVDERVRKIANSR